MTTSNSQELILEVDGLSKSYGNQPVLKDVSFKLSAGESIGVIGPSGAGKSTLLKVLDILDAFDNGSICYFNSVKVAVKAGEAIVTGNEITSIPHAEIFRSLRAKIGFVFQNLNLWEDRTVMDNLVLAPKIILNEDVESVRERAWSLCKKFSLETKVNSRVWQLSGGQRQRVAIMRALIMRPKLMLLDEITSALDPSLVVDVMDAIRSLRADGMSFLLVTHHIEFAYSICHRILFLDDGQVVQVGTPQEMRAPTADKRVKKFCEMIRSTS